MFDLIIREAASRFGLGDKAGPLVQMLLTYITNKDTGGLSGFISKLTSSGLGNVAQSWLGGGAGAQAVSSSQIESLLGGQGGLLGSITSKLGIGGATASSALGFLLPMVVGKLTQGGTVPTSLSSEVMGFSTGGTTLSAATVAGGGLMKWLPWLAAGIAALFVLSYCNKGSDAAKQAADGAKNAAATKASADATAKVAAEVVPAGSGLVAFTHDGAPALKVYFDSGKTAVAAGFADTAKAVVDHLKANATSKAVVTGFNDPTGNAAQTLSCLKTAPKALPQPSKQLALPTTA